MTRQALLFTVLFACAACGGDDATNLVPDATVIDTLPNYDISCVSAPPTMAALQLTLGGTLLDITSFTAQTPVSTTEIRLYRGTDDSLLGMGTTTDTGAYTITFGTGRTPVQLYADYTGVGLVPTRMAYNLLITSSQADLTLGTIQQSRLDALASTLATTLDPNLAVLEVWLYDCNIQDIPGATITIEGAPDAAWAMYGGSGTWTARATTVSAPSGFPLSVAATVNLPPGMHMVSVSTPRGDLGPYPVKLAAGRWNVLQVTPGR